MLSSSLRPCQLRIATLANSTVYKVTHDTQCSHPCYLSQIECDVPWRPRSGCSQWFTGVTGTLQSYNFAGGQHLANQDYSICIREEAGYCNIQYTADTFKVSMGLNPPTTTVSTASKVGVLTCSTVDYVYIPLGGAIAGAEANSNLFCGGILAPATAITTNTAVKTSEKPFQIHVRFDGSEVETGVTEVGATDIGFQIKYVQTGC